MSQEGLAFRANVSLSLLGKVEAGHRPATAGFLSAVAGALGVTPEDLYSPGSLAYQVKARAALLPLYACLLRYDLPPERPGPVRGLTDLYGAVEGISELRSRGDYLRMGALLPPLIDELALAAQRRRGATRRQTYKLLTHTYFAVHAMSYKLGDTALASLAEDRIGWSAAACGDPLLKALAAWTRCHSLLATGGPNLAVGQTLLERTRRDLDAQLPNPGPESLSIYGALLLREAMLAARSSQPGTARSRIEQAHETARRGAVDRNPHSLLTAGPVNTRIVEAAVAIENGDCAAAINIGRALQIPAWFSPVRTAHHFTDLAMPLALEGRTKQAVAALLKAEGFAAQQTLLHPTTARTVEILMSSRRQPPRPLLALTSRIQHAGGSFPALTR
jgi:transcriptional regulator with XRE-family HTH domain